MAAERQNRLLNIIAVLHESVQAARNAFGAYLGVYPLIADDPDYGTIPALQFLDQKIPGIIGIDYRHRWYPFASSPTANGQEKVFEWSHADRRDEVRRRYLRLVRPAVISAAIFEQQLQLVNPPCEVLRRTDINPILEPCRTDRQW
jgi:hypothetical protein